MKKITFNLNEDEYQKLERIMKEQRKRTGFRCSVSEVLRSLVIKEEQRIPHQA